MSNLSDHESEQAKITAQFEQAEIDRADAETRALAAKLRGILASEADAMGKPLPQPLAPTLPPVNADNADAIAALAPAIEILTQNAQDRALGKSRTNEHRAAEGLALCKVLANLTGVDDLADAAADVITQVLHMARRANLPTDEIIVTARGNYRLEVEQEAEAENDKIVSRAAPAWAWQIIDQTLNLDANSVRTTVRAALLGMIRASEGGDEPISMAQILAEDAEQADDQPDN